MDELGAPGDQGPQGVGAAGVLEMNSVVQEPRAWGPPSDAPGSSSAQGCCLGAPGVPGDEVLHVFCGGARAK